MIGDKLLIAPHHTARAEEICDLFAPAMTRRYVITVAGESGSGKSELGSEIVRALGRRGKKAALLQQDDYFVFPPATNHAMRQRNVEQVGLYEVKLDLLDCNLRAFRQGEASTYKPLVVYDEDRITHEELALAGLDVLVAEGTYTTTLRFVDLRVFIDRDYRQTLAARKERAREAFDPFIEQVLEREHRIIAPHAALADVVVAPDFQSLRVTKTQ